MENLGKQVCRCIVCACDESCEYYNVNKSCCDGYAEVAEQAEKAFAEYEEYKKLEGQGRLPKLPCAVGDWVCKIKNEKIEYHKVTSIEYTERGIYFLSGTVFCEIEDFGKTVFVTEEEAKKALEELRSEVR